MSSDNDPKIRKVPFVGNRNGGGRKNNGSFAQGPPTPMKPKFVGECEALKECVFDCAGGNQSGAFEASIKKLSIYVGSNYAMGSYVSVMVDNLSEITITLPTIYTGSDPIQAQITQLRLAQYVKNLEKLEMDMMKLYSLVYGQCTDHLISRLREMPTFTEMHNSRNALALLKEIKGLALNFHDDVDYELSLAKATIKFSRFFQGKDMTNLQYQKTFDNLVDVIEQHGGSVGVHWRVIAKILETETGIKYNNATWMSDYTVEQFTSAKDKAKERVLARTFILQSDKDRYGSMLATLENENTSGRNAYPDTRKAAFGFLNKWNITYEKKPYSGGYSHRNGSSFSQSAPSNGGPTKNVGVYCWGCGQEGVVMSRCTNKMCVKKHKERFEKKKAQELEVGEQHFNAVRNSPNNPPFEMCDDEVGYQGDGYAGYDYAGHQYMQAHQPRVKECGEKCNDTKRRAFANRQNKKVGEMSILLDSQSTHSTFCSKKLLTNIRDVPNTLRMFSNGGEIIYRQHGDLKNYGTVWYNEAAIANIISMSEAERKGHLISYTKGCLKLQNRSNGKMTSFHVTPDGLYAFQVPKSGVSLVQTVSENGSFYTPRQIAQAKMARDLHKMVGRPSKTDFVGIVKNNLLRHCPITAQDISVAENIYGQDIGTLQGKTTSDRRIYSPPLCQLSYHELIPVPEPDTTISLAQEDTQAYGDYILADIEDEESDKDNVDGLPNWENPDEDFPHEYGDDLNGTQNQGVSPRTHTVTRSGRAVKYRSDMFNNFSLLQQTDEMNEGGEIMSYAFTQYSLRQGLKKFPDETRSAAIAEMKQLHDMHVFEPVDKSDLTNQQLSHVLNSLMFVKKKRCGRFKARACADGRPQRVIYNKLDASSPTVKTESVILTSIIDAKESRVVGVYDIPGAFLHSKLDEVVHIKVTGALAKYLVTIAPVVYGNYVTMERDKEVIYLLLTRALYGCIKSALQFWKHLSGHLQARGYTLNPYDSCVANRTVNGSQSTIISHVDIEVVRGEVKWLESIYGPLVGSISDQHTYLGMDLESGNGCVKISMVSYLQEILDEFPEPLVSKVNTPAALHLFDENENAKLLGDEKKQVFHHTVAKTLWASLRARPDLLTTLSFLTCKVTAPDEDDYLKLMRMLCYIQDTIGLVLTLGIDESRTTKWWVDASFATRHKMRSQTGGTMSMGRGSVYSISRKQKLNTTSSTEAELVGASDVMPQILWTRQLLLSQSVEGINHILFQDNESAILLQKNGSGSSSRRTRHINIRYFFVKDRVDAKELDIQYCPTNEMVGDFFTKPLQGKKFTLFRKIIMGEETG